MTDSQLSPEQQLAAQQQLLKILPYILGFGWVVMIPISYLLIAPVIVADPTWQLLVTAGITLAIGIVDITFYKTFAHSVRQKSKSE
jgi:galactitol-specific phosphotransferase system IIC component